MKRELIFVVFALITIKTCVKPIETRDYLNTIIINLEKSLRSIANPLIPPLEQVLFTTFNR